MTKSMQNFLRGKVFINAETADYYIKKLDIMSKFCFSNELTHERHNVAKELNAIKHFLEKSKKESVNFVNTKRDKD